MIFFPRVYLWIRSVKKINKCINISLSWSCYYRKNLATTIFKDNRSVHSSLSASRLISGIPDTSDQHQVSGNSMHQLYAPRLGQMERSHDLNLTAHGSQPLHWPPGPTLGCKNLATINRAWKWFLKSWQTNIMTYITSDHTAPLQKQKSYGNNICAAFRRETETTILINLLKQHHRFTI